MNVVAQILAVLLGLMLIGVGILESFLYRNPRLYPIFRIRPEDQRAVRLWTVNQGFYNMVFGVGAILGVILVNSGQEVAGRTVVLFTAASHVVLGIVLVASEPKLWRGAVGQSGAAALVLVATLL
jgi:putative membrane protein